ncbi:MAG: hypothetical protein EBT56_10570 [Betaproteobacteria bacterium]|nr:hypothetical protein [Betaproteobacteria bacterium]
MVVIDAPDEMHEDPLTIEDTGDSRCSKTILFNAQGVLTTTRAYFQVSLHQSPSIDQFVKHDPTAAKTKTHFQ